VERNTIQRDAIGPLVILDLYSIRIVRPNMVQCHDVYEYQCDQCQRQRYNVQGKEAIERNINPLDLLAARYS
jgi:hypothetical protein